jgi:cyanophycinase
MTAGPLALVGGTEFQAGNEPHDRLLVAAARRLGGDRPAFILATAAARHDPDGAVTTARRWFEALGLPVTELVARTPGQARSAASVEEAAAGSLFYLCGGDPGVVPMTLAGTPTWDAIVAAWRAGAALAGSSAGAMALGEWTLIRGRVPGDRVRQPRPGLAIVPGIAVVPHFDTFGRDWIESAAAALATHDATLLGIDERTAAVWHDGRWTAYGAGGVTVIAARDPDRRASFASGEAIPSLPAPSRA